jgi:hypothetical protein
MTIQMSLEDTVRILSSMTERDHAGRHFTERYPDEVLDELEERGLIEISVPVHEPTGIEYSREYYGLVVTQEGVDLVEAYPEYHDTDFAG